MQDTSDVHAGVEYVKSFLSSIVDNFLQTPYKTWYIIVRDWKNSILNRKPSNSQASPLTNSMIYCLSHRKLSKDLHFTLYKYSWSALKTQVSFYKWLPQVIN